MENVQKAVETFQTLSSKDRELFKDLNTRIQSHTGPWGVSKGGERTEDGSITMPWVEEAPIVREFVVLMNEKELIIVFPWMEWDEGREWYALEDEDKYKKLDIETALKLITAIIRNDRFNEGALVRAFKKGDIPNIFNRLIELLPHE